MEDDKRYTSVCSAATLQADRKGFFQGLCDAALELTDSHWLTAFSQLSSDNDRLLKCYNDPLLQDVVHGMRHNVMPLYRGKAADMSRLRRMEGEKAAQKGKLEQALMLLNQSVIRAPAPGVDVLVDFGLTLSYALWARAQVLWELCEYQLCLTDLQLCLKEKIPEKYRVEVYWLMSQCYISLKETARAKVSLQVILKLLGPDNSSLKVKTEAELTKISSVVKQEPETNTKEEVRVLDSEHPQFPGLSSALTLKIGEDTGRYVVARQLINSGDVLAVEPPYTACLLISKFGSHCHHCFARLRSAVPCPECAGLAFCSAKCRDSAQVYHRYECRYMDLMIGSGMSVLCLNALRTITQENFAYWQRVCDKQPVSPNYNRIAALVTHAERRDPKDFVSRTLMALFLLRILEHSKYIPTSSDEENLSGMNLFLGSVLLHQLQCLQFNAHEIYETLYKAELDFSNFKVNYVGVGVYPSVALFNHDCYPAVTRYFRGKDIVVHSVRPLYPGDIAAENYGPVYTMRAKAERQFSLRGRYWFTCSCTACIEDWPKLKDLDENTIFLRCTTKNCSGSVTITKETQKSKEKCTKCSGIVNIKEAVRLIQSYDDDYTQGLALMAEGKLQEAIKIFSIYSDVMHLVCRPPNKNVSSAHEVLRSCLAYSHNKYIVKQLQ